MRSAAWRISFWASLAFTCGTILVFIFLDRFVANDIQRRSDAWLSGEVEVLGDVAAHTPHDALYSRVVGEVAELASREVPNRDTETPPASETAENDSVFFLQTDQNGSVKLWVGQGDGRPQMAAIKARQLAFIHPASIRIVGSSIPFRVASIALSDGSRVYLGLSERDELRVLRKLRVRFFLLWLSLVLMGSAIVFFTSRRMLLHVRQISEAASRIGQEDLKTRVPVPAANDEIAQLAHTLNHMLDRIESTVEQLHTITGSLAHDLRSPLTAIRGKLETSLAGMRDQKQLESLASAVEELDRLTNFLNTSLDVAEAKANALRLKPVAMDLDALLHTMYALYEPSLSEKGITAVLQSAGSLELVCDEGLIHRMVANLFDNELTHLKPQGRATFSLQRRGNTAHLAVQDDGAGFDEETLVHLFNGRIKGRKSHGHGLGLAFVHAVVRAHHGTVDATNAPGGGIHIEISLPLVPEVSATANPAPTA
jgi:signal transduction histidine kinase